MTLNRFLIVLFVLGAIPVLLHAQSPDEIEMQVTFLQDGFDNEPGIASFACMNRRGDRGCYTLALRLPEGFGARFGSQMLSGTHNIDLESETIRQGEHFVYLTMPTTGGTIMFYAQDEDEVTTQHTFPPDKVGITLHYEIDIILRRQQVQPRGVVLDDANRSRRTLRGRSRVQPTDTEQENEEIDVGGEEPDQDPQQAGEVYETVDQDPVLLEGFEALQERVEYPEEALRSGIQGMVYVEFVINTEGMVVNPEIVRSLSEETDTEALRVIKEAQFEPGKLDGQPVNVRYSLPVYFRLSE